MQLIRLNLGIVFPWQRQSRVPGSLGLLRGQQSLASPDLGRFQNIFLLLNIFYEIFLCK